MRLCHPPDGSTSPKYTLLRFKPPWLFYQIQNALSFNQDTCCHLVLCLWLLPFHWVLNEANNKVQSLGCLSFWQNVELTKRPMIMTCWGPWWCPPPRCRARARRRCDHDRWRWSAGKGFETWTCFVQLRFSVSRVTDKMASSILIN